MDKFDPKADEGIFLGYSLNSHAYRVYNRRTMIVEESMHVAFDETDHKVQESIEITADDDEPVIQKIVTDQLGKSVEDNQQMKLNRLNHNQLNLALEQQQLILNCLGNGGLLGIYHWTISLVRYRGVYPLEDP